jgi:acyl-ACP dehydrogenase
VEHSTPEEVNVALTEILRDDMNVDISRITPASRLIDDVGLECMHIFGGSGYLLDETPLGTWWRDMKLARVGGGTDEVLWELVAAGMKPDYEGYADFNQLP